MAAASTNSGQGSSKITPEVLQEMLQLYNLSRREFINTYNIQPLVYIPELPYSAKTTFVIMYVVIFVLALAGNSLVIYIVLKKRAIQTATDIFICSLAVSDLLITFFCIPFTLLQNISSEWFGGVLVCKTVPFVQTTAIVTGILTMTCIAIERYQGIVFPLKMRHQACMDCLGDCGFTDAICATTRAQPSQKERFTYIEQRYPHAEMDMSAVPREVGNTISKVLQKHLKKLSLGQALKCNNLKNNNGSVKYDFLYDHYHVCCQESWSSLTYRQAYTTFIMVALFLLPLAAMLFLYTRIAIELWIRKRVGDVSVLNTMNHREIDDLEKKYDGVTLNMIIAIVQAIGFFNSFNNPIVYAFMNENFKKSCISTLSYCLHKPNHQGAATVPPRLSVQFIIPQSREAFMNADGGNSSEQRSAENSASCSSHRESSLGIIGEKISTIQTELPPNSSSQVK
ncbi:hypothetical protein GOODEAATRI_018499 [Goodea atripinnis]|uniref:G-protein coupled receptors family 1 profile domain-containing protein n=1 Tax=Goodea atripinnis TaxID=208336 RepID=A0ABV0P5X4_9TELE